MKKVIVSVGLIAFLILASCQSFQPDSQEFIIQQVVTVDSKSLSDLYGLALQWSSSAFVSSKAAMDATDKENGLIIFKSRFEDTSSDAVGMAVLGLSQSIVFTVKIEVKDGRARITVYDPGLETNARTGYYTGIRQLNSQVVADEYIEKAKALNQNFSDFLTKNDAKLDF